MLTKVIENIHKKRVLRAAKKSLSEKQYSGRPFLQVRGMRDYEQRFVVQNYYRPCGYVWKQNLPADFRQSCAGNVRTLSLSGRDIHFSVAYYSLLYRLVFLQPEEMKAVENLRLDGAWQTGNVPDAEQEKRRTTAFDIMLLQHVIQAWGSLATNAEFLLLAEWADTRLKSLAADMAVQARYEQVRSKIFQNTMEPEDTALVQQAADLADAVLGPENEAGHHYRGLIAAMEGDLKAAISLHSKRRAQGYRTQFFRTADQIDDLEALQGSASGELCWPSQPIWDRRESGQLSCSLIACDEAYFYQFFKGFAESFALQNPGGLLHFHGVGFSPEMEVIEERIRGLDIEVNVSHDAMDVKSLLPDRFKGYCAGARYMYLPVFLEHYERIIIHDVDGVLTTDMESIWAHSDADIMISSLALNEDRRGHFAIWSNIGAGAFAIRRTEGSVQFATALSRYLAEHFVTSADDKERYFFSDQTGLLLATLAYKDTVSMVRMPQIFSQTDETRGPGRGKVKKAAQAAALEKQREAAQKD